MVYRKSNGQTLQSQLPLNAPVLLHERHYHGTLVVVSYQLPEHYPIDQTTSSNYIIKLID